MKSARAASEIVERYMPDLVDRLKAGEDQPKGKTPRER